MKYLVDPLESNSADFCIIQDCDFCGNNQCGDCDSLCVQCDGQCSGNDLCGGHSTRSIP